jgi:hypothetical protein
MALLSSVDSTPRAYRLKVSNAALSQFQQSPGHPHPGSISDIVANLLRAGQPGEIAAENENVRLLVEHRHWVISF